MKWPIKAAPGFAAALVLVAGGCSAKDDPAESVPGPSPTTTPSGTPTATPTASPSWTLSDEPVGSLEFRPVLMSEAAGGPVAGGQVSVDQQTQFANFNCSQPPTVVKGGLLTCEEDAGKQLLGPAVFSGGVESADAQAPDGALAWTVLVHFDQQGTAEFADLSQNLAGTGAQVAIVLDGEILSAPVIDSVITDGVVQISGSFDQSTAQELAQRITASATSN